MWESLLRMGIEENRMGKPVVDTVGLDLMFSAELGCLQPRELRPETQNLPVPTLPQMNQGSCTSL